MCSEEKAVLGKKTFLLRNYRRQKARRSGRNADADLVLPVSIAGNKRNKK